MSDREALERRVAAVHDAVLARAREGGNEKPTQVFAAIICNHCGRELVQPDSLSLVARAVVEGWAVGMNLGDADLCPACAS